MSTLIAVGMEPVWYAVISAVMAAVITPLLTWWMARKNKVQDWKRQDQLADRLLRANEVIDGKLDGMAEVVKQVEQQGNSVALELKRTNMVNTRRLATAESSPGNNALAEEAEKAYNAAVIANEKL